MGYPRFTNVQKLDGGSMPFESYLQQINLLYPNLPQMYVSYLQMIYEFDHTQLKRLLLLGEKELSYAIVTNLFTTLHTIKEQYPDMFNTFITDSTIRDQAAVLFDLTLEQYLEQVDAFYPDFPDYYTAYLVLIYEFNAMQLERMLLSGEYEMTDAMFSSYLNSLTNVKTEDPETFDTYVSEYEVKNRVAAVFDIQDGGEGGGMERTGFYTEFGTVDLAPVMTFNFERAEGYDQVHSITASLMGEEGYSSPITLVSAPIVKDTRVIGVKVMGNWDNLAIVPNLVVTIQALCFGGGNLG